MRVGIMQPYFLPYLGYYQLIANVDVFVVYDEIEYTKKGWINRNRIKLLNGDIRTITVPLQKGSDYLNVNQRSLANDADRQLSKLLNLISSNYSKAKFFDLEIAALKEVLLCAERNLFDYLWFGINSLCRHLNIGTKLIRSSDVLAGSELSGSDRVIAICSALHAETYVNPIGGTELYSKEEFNRAGMGLQFLKMNDVRYQQLGEGFESSLSVVDALLNAGGQAVQEILKTQYDMIDV